MRGRLNTFQKTMLHWREIYPYNGVHAVRISRALAYHRLEESIKGRLEYYGLTGLVLDKRHRRFDYAGGPASVEVKVLRGDQDPQSNLCSEIEKQINTPFAQEGSTNPFRFFAVEDGDAFYLGLVYDHFIAGGESIVSLLKSIVDLYTGTAVEAPVSPPCLYPETFSKLFIRYPAQMLRAILAIPTTIARSRRSFRPHYSRNRDYSNAFTCFRIAPPQFTALLEAGKRWGVTVNDIFLAILLLALSPISSGRLDAPRRRNLAIASIINIRKDVERNAANTFGQFLGSFSVSHPVPSGISLQQMVMAVHLQTSKIKRQRRYLQTIMALGLSNLLWRFISVERRYDLYQKNYPLWGGITTLNVNTLWGQSGRETTPSDYLRGGSTGPVAPLVLTLTTVRDVLSVGVTFRTNAFSQATVDSVISECARSIARI